MRWCEDNFQVMEPESLVWLGSGGLVASGIRLTCAPILWKKLYNLRLSMFYNDHIYYKSSCSYIDIQNIYDMWSQN